MAINNSTDSLALSRKESALAIRSDYERVLRWSAYTPSRAAASSDRMTPADMLDGLSAALFLVTADGRIVHANLAGHAMLSIGDHLRSVSGRLVAKDAQATKILRETFVGAGNGDLGIGVKGIALTLKALDQEHQDREHYVAHILPLTSGARRRSGMSYSAVAAARFCQDRHRAPG